MKTPVWTRVLDWSSSRGDLDPLVCVVQAEDSHSATGQAIALTSDHFAGINSNRRNADDVAEEIFPIVTFHGDLSGLIASPGHYLLREPGL
ncbi:hypothetical protein ABZT47_10190 [Sphaerisporangium sp. NPDC005289]|uniref:hypothetical protein n=1 Tax=Sphaerisporangium sp. NPDC005289 TaxID=3155247 RepID=UPI0033B02B86